MPIIKICIDTRRSGEGWLMSVGLRPPEASESILKLFRMAPSVH